MMSVHAELERIGGGRKVSLVKKRPAQHYEEEFVQYVEPVEAPARGERAPQPPPTKTTMFSSTDMESHSFISDLAMVFDVAVESEDTGFNGARSSTCDEGAGQHPCEAETEITSSKVDYVVVKIRSRRGVLFDGEWQGQRVQVKRKKDRITAKNKTGWLAIIVVDGKTEAGGSHQEGGTSRAIQVDRHVAR